MRAVVATQPETINLYTVLEVINKKIIADVFGYVLGSISVIMYLPIVLDMISKTSADGVSLETWATNVVSTYSSATYPVLTIHHRYIHIVYLVGKFFFGSHLPNQEEVRFVDIY